MANQPPTDALLDVLKWAYDQEINIGMQSDWDAGFHVWIGGRDGTLDDGTRREADFNRDQFDAIAEWLKNAAMEDLKASGVMTDQGLDDDQA